MTKKNNKKRINKPFYYSLTVIFGSCLLKYLLNKRKNTIKCDGVKFIKHKIKPTNKFKSLFKDLFIPHRDNGHKPFYLRTKNIKYIALFLILSKLVVAGGLFLIYPNFGRYSEIISFEIIELTNRSRAASGLSALRVDPVLTEAAQNKANDMADKGYFSHTGPGGKRSWQWIDAGRYSYSLAGENLAMDFSGAQIAHNALMASPSHKKNILNEKYQDIGVAVAKGEIDGKETIFLVEFFGARREAEIQVVEEIAQAKDPLIEVKPGPAPAPDINNLQKIDPTSITNPAKPLDSPDQTSKEDESQKTIVSGAKYLSLNKSNKLNFLISRLNSNTTGHTENQRVGVLGAETFVDGEFIEAPLLVNSGQEITAFDKAIIYANAVFIFFFALTVISLALAVFIKVRIQHPRLIAESLVLLFVIGAILNIKFHFLESIIS